MDADPYDAALGDLIAAWDAGRPLSAEEFRGRYPEETVAAAFADFERYRMACEEAADCGGHAAPPLAPGMRLGDFEVVDRLAAGGMGVVYRARQLSLGGRVVALKTMSSVGRTPEDLRRFEREALQLAALRHPNVAEVYGYGEDGGVLFIAMSLAEGPSLRDVLALLVGDRGLARRPEVRRQIVECVAQVADALAAMHALKLVHRDVKPANVVLQGVGAWLPGEPRDAVLVDFGLARRLDDVELTRTGSGLATPGYAAPEQMLGAEVDARADVFSLGVTLHDLLAGRDPGQRRQASAGLERLRSVAPYTDRDLDAVVAMATDPDPRQRYADAARLRDDLRAWLAARPVRARRLGLPELVVRWIRAHPRAVARVATLAIATATLVLAVDGALGIHADVRRLSTGWRTGDVDAFIDAGRRLPRWVLSLPVVPPDAATTARGVQGGAGTHPALVVAAHLQQRDPDGALLAAARHLQQAGQGAEALVARYFAASVAAVPRADADDAAGRQRELAARLAGRLFYESACWGDIEPAYVAPLRGAIRDALRGVPLDDSVALHLLTALSGCGTPEDLAGLAARWTALEEGGAPARVEVARLLTATTERIVRRALARPDSCRRVPVSELLAAWRPALILLAFQKPPPAFGPEIGDLHVALLLVLREVAPGEAAAEVVSIERDLGGALDGLGPLALDLLAAAGDGRVAERLCALAGSPGGLDALEGARGAGRTCGLLDDEGTSARVREALERMVRSGSASRDDLLGFDKLLDDWGRVRRGRPHPDHELPPETHLAADLASTAPPRAVHVWEACSELDRLLGHGEVRGAPASLGPLSALGLDTADHATWIFLGDPALFGGPALVPSGRSVRFARENYSGLGYWQLFASGVSELELPFVERGGPGYRPLVLRLYGQYTAQRYYPEEGDVFLTVALNGETIHERYLAPRKEGMEIDLAMPSRRLRPGTNTVSLRLHPASTTSFRVFGAQML